MRFCPPSTPMPRCVGNIAKMKRNATKSDVSGTYEGMFRGHWGVCLGDIGGYVSGTSHAETFYKSSSILSAPSPSLMLSIKDFKRVM